MRYNRYSYVRNNPLGFTDPSGYTEEKNTPSTTSPDNKQKEQDTTPNGSNVPQTGVNLPVAAAKVNGADMVVNNGKWVYVPSSSEEQEKRKEDIENMYNMVMKIKTNDGDFKKIKKVLKDYHDNGMITYMDNPYLNRTGEFNKDMSRDQLFRGAHRTAITETSPSGKGIQYTSLLWEQSQGCGFMSEQFIRTFLHEPMHNGDIMKGGHTPEYQNLATRKEDKFYQIEQKAVETFYDAYPKYKSNE